MQVVFVHGVNTRDTADGSYGRAVEARTDRLDRLAFGGVATIRSPYWGRFGRPERNLESVPRRRGGNQALSTELHPPALDGDPTFDVARHDLCEIVGTLSIAALQDAATRHGEAERREVEDYWMAAAEFATMRSRPSWLSQATSVADVSACLKAEVDIIRGRRPLGGSEVGRLPLTAANDFAAGRLRDWSSGFLAQFLGDAFMFFSRRDAGKAVRQKIALSIVDAAKAAEKKQHPLVLIGHSMGGSILHDMLNDSDEIADIQEAIGSPLNVNLFLSVGTQVGLFAELGQFAATEGASPLKVSCDRYWNVFDFADTLSFLCAPILPGVIDFEVNTAGGVLRSHSAYFDNAMFFTLLKARLKGAGLVS